MIDALTPADVNNHVFTVVRLRAGYDQVQVDLLLDEIYDQLKSRLLMLESPSGNELRVTVTGDDVAKATFQTVRIREGYERLDVDEFLERVVARFDDLDSKLRHRGVRVLRTASAQGNDRAYGSLRGRAAPRTTDCRSTYGR